MIVYQLMLKFDLVDGTVEVDVDNPAGSPSGTYTKHSDVVYKSSEEAEKAKEDFIKKCLGDPPVMSVFEVSIKPLKVIGE